MTLISSLEIIQGDNSSIEQFAVRDNAGDIVSVEDVNWTAAYTIRSDSITGAVEVQNTLSKETITPTTGNPYQVFQWRLNPADTQALPVGRHFLTIQIENTSLSDPVTLEIVQAPLRILPQGV